MKKIIISDREEGQRLDKFLAKYMDQAEKLRQGDQIKLFLSDETVEKFTGTAGRAPMQKGNIDLAVIYEDAHVLFVNKPAGLLSQKAKPSDVSLVEVITEYLLQSGSLGPEDLRIFRPGICNRLDRNTSGIVTAGKSLVGLQALSLGFKERTFGKYYRCLVKGRVDESAYIKGYLTKDKEKNQVTVKEYPSEGDELIETEYRPVRVRDGYTLLEVHLITGKPHQIRAHLASVRHPIIGDPKYGDRKENNRFKMDYGLSFQLLHACRLEFPQMDSVLAPLSGRRFYAEAPELFGKIQEDLMGRIEE